MADVSNNQLVSEEVKADAVLCPATYPLTKFTSQYVVAHRHAAKLLCIPCFFSSVRFMQWFRTDMGLTLHNGGILAVVLGLNIGPWFLFSFRRVTRPGGQLETLGAGAVHIGEDVEKRLRRWATVFVPPTVVAFALMPILVVMGIYKHLHQRPLSVRLCSLC